MELYRQEMMMGQADKSDALHQARRFEYPRVFQILYPFSKEESVLDIGTGRTLWPFVLAPFVNTVCTLDINAEYVKGLRRKIKVRGLENIKPFVGDVHKMTDLDSGIFDKVSCISVMEHMPKNDLIPIIDEMLRVTKTGGKIAITMDIVLTSHGQADLGSIYTIGDHYGIPVEYMTLFAPKFSVPPYNKTFTIACLYLVKEEAKSG